MLLLSVMRINVNFNFLPLSNQYIYFIYATLWRTHKRTTWRNLKNNNFQEQILTMPEKLRHAFNFLRGKVLETVGHKRTKCAIEYKLFINREYFST